MTRFLPVLALLFALISPPVMSMPPEQIHAPETMASLPDALKPWVNWVMQDEEIQQCPFSYDSDNKQCIWPTSLSLEAAGGGGRFTQNVTVFSEGWVSLPGSANLWPQEVTVNGAPSSGVIEYVGRAVLFLKPGRYIISGKIPWGRIPEMLPLPYAVGLIDLKINGQPHPFITVDDHHRLWLRDANATNTAAKGEADAMTVQVFRHVQDGIPLIIQTQAVLQVSGKSREERLQGMVPDGFTPMRVQSALPSRLEADGLLRVQVHPGKSTVMVTSYANTPLEALHMPKEYPASGKQEIWSFAADSQLRVVQVEGVPAIDPTQTEIPAGWHNLPAYIMEPDSEMRLDVKKRGLEEADADRLRLTRTWRLDSDGRGYTVSDAMNGTVSRSWRLDAAEGTKLGRVTINGQDQFITHMGDGGQGIEVRPGQMNLSADSRYAGGGVFPAKLPAIGWKHDMDSLSMNLRLPAGWTLLGASGVDSVSSSWVKSWTLLDIFLVLIAIVATARLLGGATAAILALALVLLHPQNPFFTSAALTVLLAMGLLRVVPEGRFHFAITGVRRVMLLAFVLVALPFMVQSMRDALYPQLQQPIRSHGGGGGGGNPLQDSFSAIMGQDLVKPRYAEDRAAASRESMGYASGMASGSIMNTLRKTPSEAKEMTQQLYQYDANNRVQTGFGVPDQYTRSYRLEWNGPVEQGHAVTLWLLSPAVNLLLAILRLVLLALLFVFLLGIPANRLRRDMPKQMREALCLALLAGSAWMMQPHAAKAQDTPYPPQQMLDELRERITSEMERRPECGHQCATLGHAKIFAAEDELTLYLRYNVVAEEIPLGEMAVGLPGGVKNWRPASVLVDGKPAQNIREGENGFLMLTLKQGAHDVVLSGALPSREGLSLRFPQAPHYAEAAAIGWEVQGIRANGENDGSFQLTRLKDATASSNDDKDAALESRELPDFFTVERVLDLGLSWQVHTLVSRVTPADEATSIALPLLEGESLTTPGIQVKQGKALLHFAAGEQSKNLLSTFEPSEQVELRAPQNVHWTEIWRLNASNVWHVDFSGIPRLHSDNATDMPVWHPWPGETMQITVARPEGVEGPTLTIDKSQLTVSAGMRKSQMALELAMRSSQGGQHDITLPQGAELQGVNINGRKQSIQQKDRVVTLPVTPGMQNVKLDWLQPNAISAHFEVPQVQVGAPTVNSHVELTLPHDRWLLWVQGPRIGPAVLIWGWIPVILIVAVGLARVPGVPLRAHQWFLLLLGLTQTSLTVMVIVAGWFLAMQWRAQARLPQDSAAFNFRQLVLGAWTVLSLLLLFYGVKHGLLGSPDMRVAGNGSSGYLLRWYQDITASHLPQPEVYSAPLWLYRGLMLLWALWLAFSLLRWLRWGWECFSREGYWRSGKTVKSGTVNSTMPPPGR